MSYRLRFHEKALREWRALPQAIREQFKKKLMERLEHPRVPSAALSGMKDCYKITLRQAGCRLVYRVDDDVLFVSVIAIGRRERLEAYLTAKERL
ncbi:MAG: type II toxin-antitoxin system RelE/ParE family toxin [Desulfovibrionaceae bacterium]|nr:type II toxin-antitoxin system RelE/ParE family toxin [Desulfovibrionaceae bacterium]